jgi:hypothetical protein
MLAVVAVEVANGTGLPSATVRTIPDVIAQCPG